MTKKRTKKRRARSLSEADAERLGYDCKDIAEADRRADLTTAMAKYLQAHPRIRKAYDRGRLLRNLVELAPVATIHDAARRLRELGFGFERGQDLREFLDSDEQASELWETARVNGWISVRKALEAAARTGNAKAISMMEKWALDRAHEGADAGAVHFGRVTIPQVLSLFGIHRQTLHDWTTTRGMPRNLDGTYDLAAVISWFEDYAVKKARGREVGSSDKLRDLKAEEKALDLAQRRGELLKRDEVIAGLVARWQNLINAFNARIRDLAQMLHGQTIEKIADILQRFFEDVQRQQLELPEFLDLPAEAADKLAACLEILAGREDEHETI